MASRDGTTWLSFDDFDFMPKLAGTSWTDMFHVDQGAGYPLHWDGSRWSPLRTPLSEEIEHVVVSATDVVLISSVFPGPFGIFHGFVRAPR